MSLRYISYILIFILAGLSGCATRATTSGDPAYDRARRTGICHVHQTRMTREDTTLIDTMYLETSQLTAEQRERLALFPFAERTIVTRTTPRHLPRPGTLTICPDCVKTGQEWILAHPAQLWTLTHSSATDQASITALR